MDNCLEKDFVIKCGKNSDSLERLENLCKIEAKKILPNISIKDGDKVIIPCWTTGPGFSEAIGDVIFTKDESGNIVYEVDLSTSAL
jgi:hypothetical protein